MIHFLQYFYFPSSGPWYTGNVWGNIFVVPIAVVFGVIWARTKFWPLRPLQRGMDSLHRKHDAHAAKLDALTIRIEDLHKKHDELRDRLDTPSWPKG